MRMMAGAAWQPDVDALAVAEAIRQLAVAPTFDPVRFGSVIRCCRQQVCLSHLDD